MSHIGIGNMVTKTTKLRINSFCFALNINIRNEHERPSDIITANHVPTELEPALASSA